MSTTTTQATPERKSRINIRTIVLMALVVLITLFCAFNRMTVFLWPFGTAPLYLVILGAYVLGLGSGWLVKSLLGERIVS
jgi:uncharacterized integral membrane protein